MESVIRIAAFVLIAITVLNFVLFVLGKISYIMFWSTIGMMAIGSWLIKKHSSNNK